MYRLIYLLVLAIPLIPAPSAVADDSAAPRAEPAYPAVALAAVLDAVSDETGKTFVVETGVDGRIYTGALKPREIDIATLHSLLFANGLAAVETDKLVRVLPVGRIRQQQLPLLGDAERDFAADEWVTHMVPTRNAEAVMLVPILRPLVPKQGHLVADPVSNTIVLIDRYANVQRIGTLIRRLDDNGAAD